MKQKKVLVYVGILVAMISWSMSYIWIKVVYQYYNPISTVFLRLLIASAVQYILVRGMKKLQKIQEKDIKYCFLKRICG